MGYGNRAFEHRAADVIATILSRRSVRSGYRPDPIPRNVLENIVSCGLAAPSSKNARPWRFHVVTGTRLLRAIADAVDSADGADRYTPYDPETGEPWPQWSSTVAESAEILRHVPAGIFIENLGLFSRGRATLAAAPSSYRVSSLVGYGFESIGIGAAIENMWIAAEAQGVQGVFMGDIVVAEDGIKRLLLMAGDLAGVLALGYSEEDPGARWVVDGAADDRVRWYDE